MVGDKTTWITPTAMQAQLTHDSQIERYRQGGAVRTPQEPRIHCGLKIYGGLLLSVRVLPGKTLEVAKGELPATIRVPQGSLELEIPINISRETSRGDDGHAGTGNAIRRNRSVATRI
jgi:hypothetical protein